MRLVEFGCGPWAALGNKPRNEPTEFGEALTRKRQAPRKCLRQKPLNRGVTSQAASHHAWFRSNCRLVRGFPGPVGGRRVWRTRNGSGGKTKRIVHTNWTEHFVKS